MKKRFFYGACIFLLVFLIAAACFLPHLFFLMQDAYRMGRTWTEVRTGLDADSLNIPYEMSIGKRLGNFAENPGTYFVTGTELEPDEESLRTVEEALYQDIIFIMVDSGMIPGSFFGGFEIEEWKKYAVCHEEMDKGIAVSAWYCRLLLDNGAEGELLFDEKTGTIYYLKYQNNHEESWTKEIQEAYGYDEVGSPLTLHASAYEMQYVLFSYYGADYQEDTDPAQIVEVNEGDSVTWDILLSYGQNSLNFTLNASQSYDYFPDLSLGISQIGEMIPELARN